MNDKYIINYFNYLEPFNGPEDVPDIPKLDENLYKTYIVPNLIRCGAIPKSKLKIGQWYIGDTRNTDYAMWDGKVFKYQRIKWNYTFIDTVNHFEDDNGYALFVPLKEIEKPEGLTCNFEI